MLKNHKQARILICPLDWGLGHATRCIPIIRKYLSQGDEVIIAADGGSLELLRKEFPQLKIIQLKGYAISYSANRSMALQMFLSAPRILWKIYREHQALKKMIDEYKIDMVISDNRYGLWNKRIKSIFITHQIMIKSTDSLKFLEPVLYNINKWFIKHYDECWIPDNEKENNLSGDLAHLYPLPQNTRFIGPQSRFNYSLISDKEKSETDLLVLLSGPEPQRSMLEKMVIEQLHTLKIQTAIVRGIPGSLQEIRVPSHVTIYSHLETEKMQQLILDAKVILCRSGYSTIMDLAVLQKKAIFIPTPGQTEQEYLASYHVAKRNAICFNQHQFDLEKALAAFKEELY